MGIKSMRIEIRATIVVGAISTLLACGGGGESQPATPAFDADAAFSKALAGVALSGLRAADPAGFQYTASLTYAPLSDGSFLGSSTRRSLQTTTIGLVGTVPFISKVTVFYDIGPARLLGTITDTGKTTVFSQASQLPTAAMVGQSGVFAEGAVYASPALQERTGTETLSWSIEPDRGTTALACLTSVSRSAGSVSLEKDCFRIDGAGNISGGKISIDKPGIALDFSM